MKELAFKSESLIYIIPIYRTPPPRIKGDAKPIFTESTAGLNTQFSFNKSGSPNNAKEPVCFTIYLELGV